MPTLPQSKVAGGNNSKLADLVEGHCTIYILQKINRFLKILPITTTGRIRPPVQNNELFYAASYMVIKTVPGGFFFVL